MKIVCSWCRQEGRTEFVGEKAPFDDARETHGICLPHRRQIQSHWQDTVVSTGLNGQNPSAAPSNLLTRWTGLLNFTKKMHL